MSLSAGTKLGAYEIISPIGAGGMGEVWMARDTRLGRAVAIKVMPDHIACHKDLRARFEREARTISGLNHPNICVLFDIGEYDGTNFMVLEYLEGETLAARISKGPIPLDQVLKYATQIADALDRAHRTGVSHRDVKPANIMITRDGCKVLDFGLAKIAPKYVAPDASTVTNALTSEGVVVGTLQYMAPEQYEGREGDAYSDIFAFGCVVYEMVTGKRCFEGKTKASIIAAVLGTDRPPMIRAGPVVPAALQRLVQRCLARDPEDRYQSMRDVVLELRSIGEDSPAGTFPAKTSRYKPFFAIMTAIAVVLAVTLGFAIWVSRTPPAPTDSPLARLDIDLGTDVWLPTPKGWGSSIAISPDGTRLAFVAGNPVRLFTRRLDQRDAAELPGTQGASTAFFSPDGRWVGFYSGGKLNKVPVNGGAIVPLGDLGYFAGASWSAESGVLVSAVRQGVLKIPSSGGAPGLIAMPRSGEFALSVPQSLPGGRAILFGAVTLAADKSSVEVMTIADHHRKVITSGQSPRYLSMPGVGYLIYTERSTLFAVRFDPEKLETQGTAVPILEDVAYEPELGISQFDFSPEPSGHGFLVYRSGRGSPMVRTGLQRIDSKGTRESLLTAQGNYDSPGISPDGKRIALRLNKADIWVYDPQRETMARLTFGGVVYDSPIWSPDGRYIVFGSYGKGLFQAPADGSGQPRALNQSDSYQFPYSFTADGKRLAYVEGGTAKREIWTLPLQDQGGQLVAGTPERFLSSGFSERSPSFSPDGRWIAYDSNESGKFEVYVQPFPTLSPSRGGKLLISNNEGVTPRFSRNGHDLLYACGNQIMAVAYTVKGDTFAAGKPRVWIDRLGVMPTGTPAWDLDPDGKRVVFLSPFESDEPPRQEHEVVLLLNFLDELRRKIPAGNQTR